VHEPCTAQAAALPRHSMLQQAIDRRMDSAADGTLRMGAAQGQNFPCSTLVGFDSALAGPLPVIYSAQPSEAAVRLSTSLL
jgi:hypothetical protein